MFIERKWIKCCTHQLRSYDVFQISWLRNIPGAPSMLFKSQAGPWVEPPTFQKLANSNVNGEWR